MRIVTIRQEFSVNWKAKQCSQLCQSAQKEETYTAFTHTDFSQESLQMSNSQSFALQAFVS